MKPLEGLKVLDFSQLMAGPISTMLLGDMGADVVKIEPPTGDPIRTTGETYVGESGDTDAFFSCNRNKRSVVLDLKSPEGLQAARDLCRTADVVVENFRPGTADRLGIGYDALSAINPKLIYCSISGFGQSGPQRDRPALDMIVQALSGLMQVNGTEQTGPLRSGFPYSDIITPTLATSGILAALHARNRTGVGQHVDVSMLSSTLYGMMPRETNFFATGRAPARWGNQHAGIGPCDAFATSDGRQILIVAHNNGYWRELTRVLEAEMLNDDVRLSTTAGRVANREYVHQAIADIVKTRTLDDWLERFAGTSTLYAPVRTFEEVFSDPEIASTMVAEVDHPTAGKTRILRSPFKFSGTPLADPRRPPVLGEDTNEVLAEIASAQPGPPSALV